jgi:hypothetical protein
MAPKSLINRAAVQVNLLKQPELGLVHAGSFLSDIQFNSQEEILLGD